MPKKKNWTPTITVNDKIRGPITYDFTPQPPPPTCGYCGAVDYKCVKLPGNGVCVEYAAFWTYEAAGMGL